MDTILRHPEMIAHMARAGCYSTFVGVESPSAAMLDGSGRDIRLLKDNGINIWVKYLIS
ncbi:MAG: hypothetical protein P8X55_22315 [Desulfosarcinaceae bacterium]